MNNKIEQVKQILNEHFYNKLVNTQTLNNKTILTNIITPQNLQIQTILTKTTLTLKHNNNIIYKQKNIKQFINYQDYVWSLIKYINTLK